MKKLLALFLSTALAFSPMAYASPGAIVKGDVLDGFDNLLTNPSFDRATATKGWSFATGASGAPSSSTVIDGKQSLFLTVTNSTGALLYQDALQPAGGLQGVNLEASMWVNTTQTGLSVCGRSGGTTLTSTCVAVPATGTWQKVSANMTGTPSGTVGVALYTSNTVSAGFSVDAGYVGRARNLSQVSQAQLIGQVKITGCASGWGTSSTSSFASLGTQTGCTYTVTSGTQCTAPGTNVAGITCPSLGAGSYTLTYEGTTYETSVSTNGYLQFTDGTNTALESSVVASPSTATTATPGIRQTINYTTAQSNVTFQIYGKVGSASATVGVTGQTANPGVISVYYFPSQSQLALRADVTPASWSGSSSLTASTTSSSITDPSPVSGSVTTTTSRNMTCSAASGLVGITCTLPRAGNYQVCATATTRDSVANGNTYPRVTDGSGNIIFTFPALTSATANAYVPFSGCGNYYSASGGTTTFKIQNAVDTGGTAAELANNFSVTELDAPMPAPYLTGSITSNTSGQERVERAQVASNGGITNQSGSWLSSVSNGSTGQYTLNITAGEFSATPTCTASVNEGSTTADTFVAKVIPNSATSVSVLIHWIVSTGNSGLSSRPFNVICMGPR